MFRSISTVPMGHRSRAEDLSAVGIAQVYTCAKGWDPTFSADTQKDPPALGEGTADPMQDRMVL